MAFKNCAPFTRCITKIETAVDNADDLDLVTPMYNLLEYNLNYSGATGNLWFYSKDEAANLVLILRIIIILNLSSVRLNY